MSVPADQLNPLGRSGSTRNDVNPLTYADYLRNGPTSGGGDAGSSAPGLTQAQWDALSPQDKWNTLGGGFQMDTNDPRYAGLAQQTGGGTGNIFVQGENPKDEDFTNPDQVHHGQGYSAYNHSNLTPQAQARENAGGLSDKQIAMLVLAMFSGAALGGGLLAGAETLGTAEIPGALSVGGATAGGSTALTELPTILSEGQVLGGASASLPTVAIPGSLPVGGAVAGGNTPLVEAPGILSQGQVAAGTTGAAGAGPALQGGDLPHGTEMPNTYSPGANPTSFAPSPGGGMDWMSLLGDAWNLYNSYNQSHGSNSPAANAAADRAYNEQMWMRTLQANSPNQETPWMSSTWEVDPQTGQRTQRQTLNPQDQARLDQFRTIAGNRMTDASRLRTPDWANMIGINPAVAGLISRFNGPSAGGSQLGG